MSMHHNVLKYNVRGKEIAVNVLQSLHLHNIQQRYQTRQKSIHIFASGSSISRVNFSETLLAQPAIFVNGSITLSDQHKFESIVAYVISDARFIDHAPQIFAAHYRGQPLFITQPVLEKILALELDLFDQHLENIYLIQPIDRPLSNPKANVLSKIFARKKLNISDIADPEIILDLQNKPVLGVSLNICKGFVEAGTVAYVATQLAYGLGACSIYIYGMDLINANQPRFYENDKNQSPCKLDKAVENRIIPSFDLLATQFKQNNVDVFNASDISKNLFVNLKYKSFF